MVLNCCNNVFHRDDEKFSSAKKNEALEQIAQGDCAGSVMAVIKGPVNMPDLVQVQMS